jgi:hypothetical protein
MSATQRMLSFLQKTEGYNSFSTAQARNYFGIQNVAARIYDLRQKGHPIYTNVRTRRDGSKVAVYRLGTPSRAIRSVLNGGRS